jgi:hypothetical protein
VPHEATRVDTLRTNGIRGRIAERNHETKAAIKTTEFWAMLGLVVTILVSAALIKGGDNGTDEFIAKQAWLYVSILGGPYFISRGLAKSGTYEPDADYNLLDLTERKRDGGTDRYINHVAASGCCGLLRFVASKPLPHERCRFHAKALAVCALEPARGSRCSSVL